MAQRYCLLPHSVQPNSLQPHSSQQNSLPDSFQLPENILDNIPCSSTTITENLLPNIDDRNESKEKVKKKMKIRKWSTISTATSSTPKASVKGKARKNKGQPLGLKPSAYAGNAERAKLCLNHTKAIIH